MSGERSRRLRHQVGGWLVVLIGLGLPILAQPVDRELLEDESLARLETLSKSARLLYDEGKYALALSEFKEEVKLATQLLGARDPSTIQAKASVAAALWSVGDFHAASSAYQEVVGLRRRVFGDRHPLTVSALANLAVVQFSAGNRGDARRLMAEVWSINLETLGAEHQETIRSKGNLAEMLREAGEYAEARELQEQVVSEYIQTLGLEHRSTATAISNLAGTISAMGDLYEARDLEKQVVDLRLRILGANHPDTIRAQANLAGTLQALGYLIAARDMMTEVVELLEELLGSDHPDTIVMKRSLAGSLKALGNHSEARRLEESVIEVSTRVLGHEHPGTLVAIGNLAETLKSLGELATARVLGEQVLDARSRAHGADHPATMIAQGNLAGILYQAGELGLALTLQKQLLERLRGRLGASHPDTLLAQANLATTYHALGELSEAQKLEEEALELRVNTLGQNHPDTLTLRANLAVTLHGLGDYAGAESHLEILRGQFQQVLGTRHPKTLMVSVNLARSLQAMGRSRDSEELLRGIVELRGENDTPRVARTKEEATTFFSLAEVRRAQGDLREALSLYFDGFEALELQALAVDFSEDRKMRFKGRYYGFYDAGIRIALELGNTARAFEAAERFRTQSLGSLLRDRGSNRESIPSSVREELAEIASRYDRLTRQLDREWPEPAESLLAEQAVLRRRREVIQGQLLAVRLQEEGRAASIQIEELRQRLDEDTLFLAYSLGEDEGQLFAVTGGRPLGVYPIEASSESLSIQVGRLRNMDLGVETAGPVARIELSDWLYRHLLAPVEDWLSEASRVVIVPAGPLNQLHFGALTRAVEGAPGGRQYLVEVIPIHIVQSATVYTELLGRRSGDKGGRGVPGRWLGFGDPEYGSNASNPRSEEAPVVSKNAQPFSIGDAEAGRRQSVSILETARRAANQKVWNSLSDLPFSGREVRKIAQLFPEGMATALLGAEATERRARQLMAESQIVHFALHGFLDANNPLDSFLAMALSEENAASNLSPDERRPHNGLLQAWEIIDDLELDADLVVLSACDSAAGQHRRGEGLLSLSRAFQIAGARSVLASLWAVDDASTAELMVRFYRHLLSGKPKDEALRAAQIELIRGPVEVEAEDGETELRDFRRPYHWAAFQLIGDWR